MSVLFTHQEIGMLNQEGLQQHMPRGKKRGSGRGLPTSQNAGKSLLFGMLLLEDLSTSLLCNIKLCRVSIHGVVTPIHRGEALLRAPFSG